MRDIFHNGQRAGVQGRFTISAGGHLQSQGPDLRLLGLVPGMWIYVSEIQNEADIPIGRARVRDLEQTAERVYLRDQTWYERPETSNELRVYIPRYTAMNEAVP